MQTRTSSIPSLLLVASLILASACGSDGLTDLESGELQALRSATAPFQNFDDAIAAGYDTPITSCWYNHDLGGMGYHYAMPELIDSVPSLLEPEALIYEPRQDGSMTLVGLEYIVPIDAWSGATPPTFGQTMPTLPSDSTSDRDGPRESLRSTAPSVEDQEFVRDDANGVYSLHIWLWRENPSGMYAPWNPDVSCQYAEESDDKALLRRPDMGTSPGGE